MAQRCLYKPAVATLQEKIINVLSWQKIYVFHKVKTKFE